jgi:hypothetical protein
LSKKKEVCGMNGYGVNRKYLDALKTEVKFVYELHKDDFLSLQRDVEKWAEDGTEFKIIECCRAGLVDDEVLHGFRWKEGDILSYEELIEELMPKMYEFFKEWAIKPAEKLLKSREKLLQLAKQYDYARSKYRRGDLIDFVSFTVNTEVLDFDYYISGNLLEIEYRFSMAIIEPSVEFEVIKETLKIKKIK